MIRIYRDRRRSIWFYVGPWCARLCWCDGGSFGYLDSDGPITRFIRRWWSGWHRWRDEA